MQAWIGSTRTLSWWLDTSRISGGVCAGASSHPWPSLWVGRGGDGGTEWKKEGKEWRREGEGERERERWKGGSKRDSERKRGRKMRGTEIWGEEENGMGESEKKRVRNRKIGIDEKEKARWRGGEMYAEGREGERKGEGHRWREGRRHILGGKQRGETRVWEKTMEWVVGCDVAASCLSVCLHVHRHTTHTGEVRHLRVPALGHLGRLDDGRQLHHSPPSILHHQVPPVVRSMLRGRLLHPDKNQRIRTKIAFHNL